MADTLHYPTRPMLSLALPLLLAGLWGLGIYSLARNGAFVEPPEALPLRVMAAAVTPVVLFLAVHALSGAVRAWVAAFDLALVVAVQTWRVLGMVFLFLWRLDLVPAVFAIPAGVGDIAVGVLAVYVTLDVLRQRPGWPSRVRLLALVGLLDFAVAFATAILSGQGRVLQFAGEPLLTLIQTAPMAMIPAFAVPLFTIFHIISLMRLRGMDV